jgi:hypothetical protein
MVVCTVGSIVTVVVLLVLLVHHESIHQRMGVLVCRDAVALHPLDHIRQGRSEAVRDLNEGRNRDSAQKRLNRPPIRRAQGGDHGPS